MALARIVGGVILGGLLVQAALAQPESQAPTAKACAQLADDAQRLICYDRAIAAADAQAAAAIARNQQEAEARAAAARQREQEKAAEAQRRAAEQAAQAKLDAFGASTLPPDRRAPDPVETIQTVRARVAETSQDAYGALVLTLDNGQKWRQTDATTIPHVRPADEVLIQKRSLGSYRLTFVRQSRAISVQRDR